MILVCWESVIILESVSRSEWENLGKEEVVEEVGFSEDLSSVAFPWPGTEHLPSSAGFQLFLGWVPLAGAVPGLVCILKAYGYTDLAGSENK